MTDQPAPPKTKLTDAGAKWLPVRRIDFATPTSIPGAPARSELTGAITQTNVARWLIEYSPAAGDFKITYYSTDKTREPEVRIVPKTNVKAWEPG